MAISAEGAAKYAGEKLWRALPAAAILQQHMATYQEFPARQAPPEGGPEVSIQAVLKAADAHRS